MNRRRFEHARLVIVTTGLGTIPAAFLVLVAAFETTRYAVTS